MEKAVSESDTEWTYQLLAEDTNGVQKTSNSIGFSISNDYSGYNTQHVPPAPSPPSNSGKLLVQSTVIDSDWSNGGTIQSAIGHILLKFGYGERYFCTGSVVKDDVTGRSIVLTAAHCAYDDVQKKFATKAIFIPDQASTTGSHSDFNCSNDRYGCWYLSFAVVEKG